MGRHRGARWRRGRGLSPQRGLEHERPHLPALLLERRGPWLGERILGGGGEDPEMARGLSVTGQVTAGHGVRYPPGSSAAAVLWTGQRDAPGRPQALRASRHG